MGLLRIAVDPAQRRYDGPLVDARSDVCDVSVAEEKGQGDGGAEEEIFQAGDEG